MDLVNFIEKFNWQTIIAMFAIGWYFTREIRDSLKILDKDIKEQGNRIDRLNEEQIKRTDKLYQMFIDLLKERK